MPINKFNFRILLVRVVGSFAIVYGTVSQCPAEPLSTHFGTGSDPSHRVVTVEEEWELVVATPDETANAPQVTCVISPVGNADNLYAAFAVNHRTLPAYTAGGLQLQLWNGESALNNTDFLDEGIMSSPSETVSWTQCMALENGQLRFGVKNGSSATWGTFGANDDLRIWTDTLLTSLNGYDAASSLANSGVVFAGNRVASLKLKRLRVVTADGEEHVFELNWAK